MNRTLFRWHRRIGITSALFVLVLSITGLLLLFSTSLNLDQKTWGGTLVGKVYNLVPKTDPVGFYIENPERDNVTDGNWIIMVDGLVYVGSEAPTSLEPPLLGAAWKGEYIAFSNAEETVLTLEDGTLVERSSPGGYFDHAEPSPLPPDVKKQVLERYSGRGMPASRVLLDIHTGRFFGPIGTWIMGLATILLIALSITGLIMWTKTDQRRAKREKIKKELATLKEKTY